MTAAPPLGWGVYAAMLRELQREYGVRTVLLMTDDSTGKARPLPLQPQVAEAATRCI